MTNIQKIYIFRWYDESFFNEKKKLICHKNLTFVT